MITLNIIPVLQKARKAFDAGLLQCQDPAQMGESCTYSGPCAIGASLDAETAVKWDNHLTPLTIDRVIVLGKCTSDNPVALQRLQIAHDNHSEYQPFEATLIAMEVEYML